MGRDNKNIQDCSWQREEVGEYMFEVSKCCEEKNITLPVPTEQAKN